MTLYIIFIDLLLENGHVLHLNNLDSRMFCDKIDDSVFTLSQLLGEKVHFFNWTNKHISQSPKDALYLFWL